MKLSFKKGLKIWIAVLVSVSVLLAFTAKDIYKTISDSYKLYNAVFQQILLNYADPLDAAVDLAGKHIDIDDFLTVDAEVQPNGLVQRWMDRPQRQRVPGLLNRVAHIECPVCREVP